MQQDKDTLKKMLERYRLGRSDLKERASIIAWLTRLDLFGAGLSETHLRQQQHRSLSELQSVLQPVQKATLVRFPLWIRTIAASLLIITVLGVFHHYDWKNPAPPQNAWAEITTAHGEVKKVTLVDGTLVTLNSMSRLRYPLAFEGNRREVTLSGQGFFSVKHQQKQPFHVHAGKLDVQVLGTSFDIRAYGDEPEIRIGVATGKVGVLAAKQAAQFLSPGQGLEFRQETMEFVRHQVDGNALGSWQQRRLFFKNQSLKMITRELGRCYSVQFVFADERLKEKKLSLSTRNQNLVMIMKAMAASGGFRYTIKNNIVTLK